MAGLTNTIAWRVRGGGNDVNGGGFDYATTNITAVTATGSGGGGAILSGDTTLTVSGHTGWPASGNYYARLGPATIYGPGSEPSGGGSEIVQVTAGQGTNSWTVTRGALGTTALAFAANVNVDNCLSQCNTAAFSGADGTSNASTTFTSATANFNETVVGNVLWLASGTNGTVGAYLITGFTNSTTITLDRNSSSAAMTNGAFKIGGAWATVDLNMFNVSATFKPGHVMYIRAGGSGSIASPDYTFSSSQGWVSLTNGDTTNGYFALVGENGMPFIRAKSGSQFYRSGVNNVFNNIYWLNNGSAAQNITGTTSQFLNCIFDQANSDCCMVIGTGVVAGCEFWSSSNGAAGSSFCLEQSGHGMLVDGCNIHDCKAVGIQVADYTTVANSIIAKCNSDGIAAQNGGTTSAVINCTLDGNLGHGININSAASLANIIILGNIISNHTGVSKNGITVATGTTALNDRLRGLIDYNSFYNNTANVNALTLGGSTQIRGYTFNDNVGVDPQYAAQSTENYALGTNLKALGYPRGAFLQSKSGQTTGVTSYMDSGGVQRQEAGGGGGGMLVHPGMVGGAHG